MLIVHSTCQFLYDFEGKTNERKKREKKKKKNKTHNVFCKLRSSSSKKTKSLPKE